MRKLIALFLCVALSLVLFSCGTNAPANTGTKAPTNSSTKVNAGSSTVEPSKTDAKPAAMIKEICKGLDTPESDVFPLNKENFEAYSFVKWQDGIEAACEEAQTNIVAHSLVLIKTDENKAPELAKQIAERADVRKWICVSAEVGKVMYAKGYVFLVMTEKDVYEGLQKNFAKVVGTKTFTVVDVKSQENE